MNHSPGLRFAPFVKGGLALLLIASSACGRQEPQALWSAAERTQIAALSLSQLPPPPPDPSNAVADRPAAAALGEKLFFDTRLSASGKLSCASCHQPERHFTDGLPVSRGLGTGTRNAPSLLTAAWSPWQFWDGRADSLWSQATVPMEHPDELGLTRRELQRRLERHHAGEYAAVFGHPPAAADDTRALVNTGKALAAFLRTLRPQPGRFDRFADALAQDPDTATTLLTAGEQNGLKLYLGKGQCLRCHSGPLLTNHAFHNTGLAPQPGTAFDRGRADGLPQVLASDFNCRGPHGDAADPVCPHLDFAPQPRPEWVGAFKTPSLRNTAVTGPWMHDGRFTTLAEVLDHYNRAPQVSRPLGHTELFPLGLTADELSDLEAFLHTLTQTAARRQATAGQSR
jgi:cytochrome c peroxidase